MNDDVCSGNYFAHAVSPVLSSHKDIAAKDKGNMSNFTPLGDGGKISAAQWGSNQRAHILPTLNPSALTTQVIASPGRHDVSTQVMR